MRNSLAHRLSAEHERRLARWAAAAVPDPGINLKRQVIGWRGPPSARPREPEPPPPEVPPEPVPEPAPLLPANKPQQIIRAVCERFDISPEEIRSKGRTRRCMVPRHVAVALMRELTTMSSPQISRVFERDRTFALFAVKRVTHMRATDPWLAAHFDELIVQLSEQKGPPGAVQ